MGQEERRVTFFADLAAICAQTELLSSERRLGLWQTVSYETRLGKGVMLAAQNKNQPAPVWLCPALTGWHRIFVGVVALVGGWQNNSVHLRLTDDPASTQFKPASDMVGGGIEEVFWKCADLTGQQIELKKYSGKLVRGDCILGWLRFEPMSEEEIAAFQKDEADTTTKNIYVANDMHCMGYLFGAQTQRDWDMAAQPYEQSDVEWLSVENVRLNTAAQTVPAEECSFPRDGDENVLRSFSSSYTDEMLQNLVRRGHALGLKMCVSQRMGGWCNSFPFDQGYFENAFYLAHPECRCVDRDGAVTDAMSYCYPQVQAYITDQLLRQAANGFDAVELMFHRGVPYVLFEQPFLERFAAKYGDDPRELPWDDPRITEIRCLILTQFVRELRRALDAAGFSRVSIHVRAGHTLYDNRLFGLDVENLASEGLIGAVLVYPARWRENLTGDVWQEDGSHKIDLRKYPAYTEQGDQSVIIRQEGFYLLPSIPDSHGQFPAPETESERIAEWVGLENRTGVNIYFDIMPRHMSAAEYRRRLLEIYEAGGKRISLWDTQERAAERRVWNLLRRAGHREEILAAQPDENGCSLRYRFLRLGEKFIGRVRPSWGS